MGQLYKLDFPNGKSYIGITTKTASERFAGHRVRCRSAKGNDAALYHAWRKHGEPQLAVLAIVEDADLPAAEIRAIRVFNTLVPNGYNMTPGGDVSPLSDPLIAAKLIGNKNAEGSRHARSAEYKAKLSKALAGNKNGLGNNHGVGNRNATGKRSPEAIANIKAGIAAARRQLVNQ